MTDDRTDDRWEDQTTDLAAPADFTPEAGSWHSAEPDGAEPPAGPVDRPQGDAELVAQVREGRDEPYAELYRRHQPAALALARRLTEHTSADDVVSEAFEKLLQRIREGRGPEAGFRPYLLRTVRTVAVDTSRRTRRLVVAEDPEDAGHSPPTEGDALVDAVHERTTLARAFAALPERWQTFLWLSFVDDANRAEIAEILGINVASVSALGYRAREGLRRAYLDAHLQDAPTPECREVWPLLAGATRGALAPAQQARVDAHVAVCDHCRAALAELEAVNTRFGAVLAPIVLGAAGPAYLAAVQEDAGAAVVIGAEPASSGATGAGTAAGAGHSFHGLTGMKATLAGFGKVGAASVAVVACVSTVAVIALLAGLTAPLASERSVVPIPGLTTSGDGSGSASDGDDSDGTASDPGGSTAPGDPSSSASDDPSDGDPSEAPTSGAPTFGPSAGPTAGPSGGPTTGGPNGGPTGGPTGGPGTSPGGPTSGPTSEPTDPAPTTPGPSTPAGPTEVNAGLGSIRVTVPLSTGELVHIRVPVSLQGGSADLEITVSVRGLNKFTRTQGAGEGNWACIATTPMAGANKLAVVRCTLNNASPSDALDLGMNLGYAGQASITAVLSVSSAVDTTRFDDSVSSPLP